MNLFKLLYTAQSSQDEPDLYDDLEFLSFYYPTDREYDPTVTSLPMIYAQLGVPGVPSGAEFIVTPKHGLSYWTNILHNAIEEAKYKTPTGTISTSSSLPDLTEFQGTDLTDFHEVP